MGRLVTTLILVALSFGCRLTSDDPHRGSTLTILGEGRSHAAKTARGGVGR